MYDMVSIYLGGQHLKEYSLGMGKVNALEIMGKSTWPIKKYKFWSIWYRDEVMAQDYVGRVMDLFADKKYGKKTMLPDAESFKNIFNTLTDVSFLMPENYAFVMNGNGRSVSEAGWKQILKWYDQMSIDEMHAFVMVNPYPTDPNYFTSAQYVELCKIATVVHISHGNKAEWRNWISKSVGVSGRILGRDVVQKIISDAPQDSLSIRNVAQGMDLLSLSIDINKHTDLVDQWLSSNDVLDNFSPVKAILCRDMEQVKRISYECSTQQSVQTISCMAQMQRFVRRLYDTPLQYTGGVKEFLIKDGIPEKSHKALMEWVQTRFPAKDMWNDLMQLDEHTKVGDSDSFWVTWENIALKWIFTYNSKHANEE